jgi:predicted nucleotidyltransferase
MKPNFARILADEYASEDYRESKDFDLLCVTIAQAVKDAEKQRIRATYRYLNEVIAEDKRRYISEAVDKAIAAGLITKGGSLFITEFISGGKEIVPNVSKFNASALFYKEQHKAEFTDIGLVKA